MSGRKHSAEMALAAMQPGAVYTSADLRVLLGVTPRATFGALRTLRRSGLVERTAHGRYALTEEGGRASAAEVRIRGGHRGTYCRKAPSTSELRIKLWRAMRVARVFTAVDIAQIAGAGRLKTVREFVRCLSRAGYVHSVKKRPGFESTWALVRDTGPLAPTISIPKRILHDSNTGEEVPLG